MYDKHNTRSPYLLLLLYTTLHFGVFGWGTGCGSVPYKQCLDTRDCLGQELCIQGQCLSPEPIREPLQETQPNDREASTLPDANEPDGERPTPEDTTDTTTDKAPTTICAPLDALPAVPRFGYFTSSASVGTERVLLGFHDGSLALWDTTTKRIVRSFSKAHTNAITTIAVHPKSQHFVTASNDSTIKVWSLNEDKPQQNLTSHQLKVNHIRFLPDGRYLASASLDGLIKLWSWPQMTHIDLKGHNQNVRRLAFSGDGNTLYSIGSDNAVRTWDIKRGAAIEKLFETQTNNTFLEVDKEGRWIAYATLAGLYIWDVQSKKERQIKTLPQGKITYMTYDPNGGQLLLGNVQGDIYTWHPTKGTSLAYDKALSPDVKSIHLSSDGRHITATDAAHMLARWNVETRKVTHKITGYHDAIKRVRVSPDGKTLLTASNEYIASWSLTTWQPLHLHNNVGSLLNDAAYAPDGQLVARIQSLSSFLLWEPNTGKTRATFRNPLDQMNAVTFAKDGKTFATAGPFGRVRIWETATGKERKRLPGAGTDMTGIAYNPENTWLAAAAKTGAIKLYQLVGGNEVKTLNGHNGPVNALTFSNDGTRLFSASEDSTIKVWDTRTGRVLETWDDHTSAVNALALHPQGRYLASGADDNQIRLWDTTTGKTYHIIKEHRADVLSLSFHPKGTWLISSGKDRTAMLWKCLLP